MVNDPVMLDVHRDQVPSETFFVPSDGQKGGGKRVRKNFPMIEPWVGIAKIMVIDDEIPNEIFARVFQRVWPIQWLGPVQAADWRLLRAVHRQKRRCGDRAMSEEVVKPPYSAAAEIERLVNRLIEAEPLEIITHDQMSETIGESATSPRGRNIVARSRERIRREHGYVFRAITGVGYERCDDPSKLSVVSDGIRSVRRKVRRSQGVLDVVELDKLEQANRTQYVLNKTVLGLLRQGSDPKFKKAVEQRLSDANSNLGKTDLLRLFGKKKESL